MPIRTRMSERARDNSLRFDLSESGYRLAEYCVAGRGCWATPTPRNEGKAKSIEVALSR